MCTEGTESPHWSLPIAMLIEEAAISLVSHVATPIALDARVAERERRSL